MATDTSAPISASSFGTDYVFVLDREGVSSVFAMENLATPALAQESAERYMSQNEDVVAVRIFSQGVGRTTLRRVIRTEWA